MINEMVMGRSVVVRRVLADFYAADPEPLYAAEVARRLNYRVGGPCDDAIKRLIFAGFLRTCAAPAYVAELPRQHGRRHWAQLTDEGREYLTSRTCVFCGRAIKDSQ
jgi:hypothetical protein